MSEASAPVYRCTCPHCQKVLKIRLEWAGKRGTCPQCLKTVEFPAFRPPDVNSATTQQLLKLISPDDNPTFNDLQSERLALLLSQGSCMDYRMADTFLAGRALSPRQWRRTLNAADLRESMRVRLESRAADADGIGLSDGHDEPVALQLAADTATPNAWKILARVLYYQRRGTCDSCETNPTGLNCIYRTFNNFIDARQIPQSRADHWKSLLHRHLGL